MSEFVSTKLKFHLEHWNCFYRLRLFVIPDADDLRSQVPVCIVNYENYQKIWKQLTFNAPEYILGVTLEDQFELINEEINGAKM